MKFLRNRICLTFALILLLSTAHLFGAQHVELVMTSNTGGNFSRSVRKQSRKDSMLLLAAQIMRRTSAGATYIDLGNAFYPGILSKFSYGSAVMDYFHYTNCLFTLVAAEDLRIGIQNLKFLQKSSPTILASSNIYQGKERAFTPYVIKKFHNKAVAFITLSSNKLLFDVAEKNVYKVELQEDVKVLKNILAELKSRGIEKYILVSGKSTQVNVALMDTFKEISLVISGGDNSAELYKKNTLRIDFQDGRSLVTIPPTERGYYRLVLDLEDGVKVVSTSSHVASYSGFHSEEYDELLWRIARWKRHLTRKIGKVVVKLEEEGMIDAQKVANLLRHRYDAEVGIVQKNAIKPVKIQGEVRLYRILAAINDNFPVFTYKLTGSQLLTLKQSLPDLQVEGMDTSKNTIQRRALSSSQTYTVVSTQSIHDMVERSLGKVPYENRWKNLSDIVLEDLRGEKILLKKSYAYLDQKFHYLIDVSALGYVDWASIYQGANIDTPVGQVSDPYLNYGFELTANFTFYNDIHEIVFTPYIAFAQDGTTYSQNLIRATLVYNVNVNFLLKPYNKTQMDTVIVDVDGRPFLFRETIGAYLTSKYVTGKLGGGFEEEVTDDVPMSWGFEVIVNFNISFWKYFTYSLAFDSFISIPYDTAGTNGYFKSEITNALTFSMTSVLKLTLKHKWYFYYSMEHEEFYSNSELIASINLKTNFKF